MVVNKITHISKSLYDVTGFKIIIVRNRNIVTDYPLLVNGRRTLHFNTIQTDSIETSI